MKCKYIIVDQGGFKLPYVFSELCTHSDVAHNVGGMVVGAGFCYIDEDRYHCYGESVSCKVKSNGQLDADLLNRLLGVDL